MGSSAEGEGMKPDNKDEDGPVTRTIGVKTSTHTTLIPLPYTSKPTLSNKPSCPTCGGTDYWREVASRPTKA
jgi:hypothetical protein